VTVAPEISVVIPVWDDYVARLPAALASLRGQGVEFATLVVDNASTTPVPACPGVIMLSLERRVSVGEARNAGLAAATTPLVFFLDADDELLPGTLGRLRARLAARPWCVVSVAAGVGWLDTGGDAVAWPWPRPLAYRLCRHRALFAAMTALRNAYPTVCALVRADVLRDAGGFADADHEEDWRPAVTLAVRGGVDLDPRPGRRYRVSDRSLYGAGADLATMLANRRELRRSLRRDRRTRKAAIAASGVLAGAHVLSACVKLLPRRGGHARLISSAAAARDAQQRARHDGQVAPP
jgi:glycosyltransferase involved in cell wall biosynthesis